MTTPSPLSGARPSHSGTLALLVLGAVTLAALAAPAGHGSPALAQACPPYCETPVITPAWHLHMCDVTYEEQLVDNHCMIGRGITDFPSGSNSVFIIYCHKYNDTVRIVVKDSGGGEQFVNHPDGITYNGDRCESMEYRERTGIPPGGSPYYTSASWPEGPFSGIGAGIEWFVGLYVLFDADIYYGPGAEAVITARDPAANLDSFVKERITVRVTSDLDPVGIAVVLEEQNSGAPIFRALRPVRFSTEASNEANGVIKVADRSTLKVTYCPRDCRTPYTDDAQWLAGAATVTPTPLPTYSGPRPTVTPTAPPEVRIETLTLRPATEDVGYVPQISNNKSRVNHLGYPTIYAGMWTRGDNVHYGMVQFDLSSVPLDARPISARLEMIGQARQFYDGGTARVELLGGGIDALWRDATFQDVHTASVLGRIGPDFLGGDLAEGRLNLFGFTEEQLALVADRLRTTRRLSFRIVGPTGADNSLFAWHSGVDLYSRATATPDPAKRPALVLGFAIGPTPSPTRTGGAGTTTPTALPTASPSATATGPTPVGPTATVTPSTTASVAPGTAPTPTPSTSPTPTATDDPAVTKSPTPAATTATPGEPTPAGTSGTPAEPTMAPIAATPTPDGPPTGRQACVLAYDDRDADGLRDPSERFLANVTVRLTHVPTGAFITWTTDGANDPDYCWNGLSDGRYILRLEDLPSGLAPSGPASHTFDVPFSGASQTFAFGARRTDVEPPSPTGEATAAASPTDGPSPTASLTPSPSPTPSPTASPTVVGPAGDVCVAVYFDRNGDGFRDPGEGLIGGAEILVETEARTPSRRLLSGPEDAACARVAVGVYYVTVAPGAGYRATTATETVVLLTTDSRQELAFGWRAQARPAGPLYVPFAYRPAQRH